MVHLDILHDRKNYERIRECIHLVLVLHFDQHDA